MDTNWRTTGYLIWLSVVAMAFVGDMSWAGDFKSRVPREHLEEAKAFTNPLSPSPENVATGRKLYEGRAYCSACHGRAGEGGFGEPPFIAPGAPPPTNFGDAGWQAARTDGEIFWILKHGSHGTDMAPFMPLYISEEEAWAIVTYLRTFGGT
jgi:mono/diheme cytochrome c family protein